MNFINTSLWKRGIFLHLHLTCISKSWEKYIRPHPLNIQIKMTASLSHYCTNVSTPGFLLLYKNSRSFLNLTTGQLLLPLGVGTRNAFDSVWGTRYSRKSHCVTVAPTIVGGLLLMLKLDQGLSLTPAASHGFHPLHPEGCSYSWLLTRIRTQMQLLGAGVCHNHCLIFKNKTQSWHLRKEEVQWYLSFRT